MDIDFTNYNDEELDSLRVQILIEQERRDNLAQIPDQVADLAKTYRAGGGDEAALMNAVRTPSP